MRLVQSDGNVFLRLSRDREDNQTEGNECACAPESIIRSTHVVVMENIKLTPKAPTLHCVHNSSGPLKAPDQEHADEIGKRPVRVDVGSRVKRPDLRCSSKPMIFVMNDVNVPE